MRRLFFALASFLLLAPATWAEENPHPIDTPPMKLGAVRPALDAVTLDGSHPISWNEMSGKVVLVDFWATWCAPCVKDMPKLTELQKTFAGKPVVFYSITYEKPGFVRDFLTRHPGSSVALDNDFHTFKSFNAWAIPAIYIFDGKGKLLATLHPDELAAKVIQAALDGKHLDVPPAKSWSDPVGCEKYFRSLRDQQAN